MASTVAAISSGLRPIRSENDPMIGSQMKLDTPTQTVTSRLSRSVRFSSFLPKVGVYAVIR
ncbi:hypothetical protein APX70_03525 [Pseudomonas syringae pv. maculicola]|uniref:Uncharacterized protein n=1 Tax=Pseudomonas syringae pv. maculicola TaxID=59511 RepID=A0A3M2XHV8_PSEYM|nr:hypothetical protein APX70_03525 [Pseudomonas syringae pv. maculicola]